MSDLLPEHLALQLLPGKCTGIQYTFIFVKIARVWDALFMSTHVTGEKELVSTFPWDLPPLSLPVCDGLPMPPWYKDVSVWLH